VRGSRAAGRPRLRAGRGRTARVRAAAGERSQRPLPAEVAGALRRGLDGESVMRGIAIAAAALAAVGVTALGSGGAKAQSFAEQVSDDACDRARAFDIDDVSPADAHARRACRLQHFEIRLAAERRQAQAAEMEAREARVQAWVDSTQPVRAVRPLALLGFVGSGLATYGLTFSWEVLRQLELDVRVGWRQMTCWNESSSSGADCTRRAIGGGVRWFLSEKDFSPYLGGGFAVTTSHLQILRPQAMSGSPVLA